MQRILSLETASSAANQTSEFVTKRLCCSVILTVAFLTMVGGFFLGKFVADRSIDKMRYEMFELSKKVNTLNANFRNTFNTGLNVTECSEYIFLRCNFSNIGKNASGLLTSSDFLNALNDCFSNG